MKDVNAPSQRRFNVEEAMKAIEKGELRDWVLEYLLHEGNHGLAHALQVEEVRFIAIVEFPLLLLRKIEGPEQEDSRQPLHVWEERVSKLEAFVKSGEQFPPLIVTDFWNPFEIVDGNHRHEALLRQGITKYWTIFFLRDEKNKLLVEQHRTV